MAAWWNWNWNKPETVEAAPAETEQADGAEWWAEDEQAAE